MNYGEELAYWYFRFNGFFPLTDFVMHTDFMNRYPSDCDVLAIRHPHVYEDVGGRPEDWDDHLQSLVNFSQTLGVICEVKTGDIDSVFPHRNIIASIRRLGLLQDSAEAETVLQDTAVYATGECQIAKILITDRPDCQSNSYEFIPLRHARNFIAGRIRKYKNQKFAQRLYFNSTLLQEIIWETRSQ